MNVPMQILAISKYFLFLWKSIFYVIISFTTKPWFLWWPRSSFLSILISTYITNPGHNQMLYMVFNIYMFLMGDVFSCLHSFYKLKIYFIYLVCLWSIFITILSAKAFIFPVFPLSQQQRKLFNGEWTYGHHNNICYVYWCFWGGESFNMLTLIAANFSIQKQQSEALF